MAANDKFRNNVVMKKASVNISKMVLNCSHESVFSDLRNISKNTNMSDFGLKTSHPSGGCVYMRDQEEF